MGTVWKDIRWGAGWGLFGGFMYMGFAAVVVYGLKGGFETAPAGVTPLKLFGLYPFAGLTAGLVGGLLRPYTKSRRGAMAVGMVAAVPLTIGAVLLTEGPVSSWYAPEWFGVIGGAILLGGMGGYILWNQHHAFDPEAAFRRREEKENTGEAARTKKRRDCDQRSS
jgi:hypothetical protein